MKQIKELIKPFLNKELPDVQPGDTIKIYQKFKETPKKGQEAKEKTQIFEGIVIAKKHRNEVGATITVRKVIGGVGVERIFPLHLPSIEKIEITKRSRVRRAKLYYLRTAKGKRARLKRKEFVQAIAEDEPKQKITGEPTKEVEEEVEEKEIKKTEEAKEAITEKPEATEDVKKEVHQEKQKEAEVKSEEK